MRLRKGITMAMLVVIVAVLGILTTVTVTAISNSYTNSKLAIWTSEMGPTQKELRHLQSSWINNINSKSLEKAMATHSSILA